MNDRARDDGRARAPQPVKAPAHGARAGSAPEDPTDTAALLERVRSGNRRALARAITMLENDTRGAVALRAALAARPGHAHLIGVTGPPGAGKSTLVNALVRVLAARGRRVAVLAVDPSSPISGGAVLGDRVRMAEVQSLENVFIRSIASRGHAGGLARAAREVAFLLSAAGFDDVFIETVGAGQSDVAIAGLADTRLVVCPPGLGDDVQAIKAGILEIADAYVVNKADLPGAERTERDLLSALELGRRASKPPVLRTAANTGEGIDALADWLLQRPGRPAADTPAPTDAVRERVQALFSRDAYAAHLGIEGAELEGEAIVVRMRVGEAHVNHWGGCHGGAIFSLADTALGLACNADGGLASLIDSHMAFSVAVRPGTQLTARATELTRSRKLGVYRVAVTREDGTLVASLTGTVYRSDKKSPDSA